MIKYPHIKKNAACQNTHNYPGPKTAPKSGLARVYLIFEKFAQWKNHPCCAQVANNIKRSYNVHSSVAVLWAVPTAL